jgi:hypothetical protein
VSVTDPKSRFTLVPDGKPIHFDVQIHATCPFCDRTWKAGEFEGEVPGVMHDEPACDTFLELSPIVFMAKARIAGARTLS